MSNKNTAINGAKWTSISTVIGSFLQFAQMAVLARLILPSSFGIVALSSLVINFLSIFVHLGFANSIIYKQEASKKSLSTIYFFNIMIGLLMFSLIWLTAPLLIVYFKEPRLGTVLKVAAFYFPVVFFGQMYNTLLEKDLKFKYIAISDIVTAILTIIVTVGFAYAGYQEMALIYGQLSAQITRTILMNVFGRKLFQPIFYFNLKEIKEHLIFGIFNTGDSLIIFANGNIDTILIGGVLGVKELGYYTMASTLAVYPVSKICPIITQTCYPIMAKMNGNSEALKSAFLKIVDLITYIIIPLLGGLYIMVSNVIPLFYGPHWGETIPLIKIFVFMALASSLTYPSSPLVFSKGKPNLLFYINLITFCIRFPLVLLLAKYYGVMGVAVAYLISNIISFGMVYGLVQYLVGSYVKTFLRDISKPIIFCLIMIGVILLYRHFVTSTGLVNTIIQIAIGGMVYIGLTLKYKMSLKEILNLRQAL
ncbi:MAG: polysaccharide biosynthesis protein [Mucilaginibacter sp.]|jgi:lipopolysaccharide exporter|nr:polysaccharide biosynthesis protein [Mucilaginibacter sp.]